MRAMIHYPQQQFIMHELRVNAQTVVDWSSFCREVCFYWLQQCSQVHGGPDVVVEIDEVKTGHRNYTR